LAGQRQEEPQYLCPIALEFFRRSNRSIASYTTLPYRICNFVLGILRSWQREIGEKQQVNQGIDQLLCQRLHLLKFFARCFEFRKLFL
jgi:hypothetical protein